MERRTRRLREEMSLRDIQKVREILQMAANASGQERLLKFIGR